MKKLTLFIVFLLVGSYFSSAQNVENQKDTSSLSAVQSPESKPVKKGNGRLTIGGYGEVALTRNFYSDNVYRYSQPLKYAQDPSHGRFDIPHAVIYLNYNFGKGWSMQMEIEFEHTGTGSAVEQEFDEAGEWESEIEKGGEVALEQFWIQKSFFPQLNVRVGHMVVPVGGLNHAHEPLNYFTVYRPEGEYTILPSTWHDTGIGIWGQAFSWLRYEVMAVSGLDAYFFDRDHFVRSGATSPFEFKVANNYGFAGRLDFFPLKGLRASLSGYFGNSFHNGYPNDLKTSVKQDPISGVWTISDNKYASVKGQTLIGAFDFEYKGYGLVARGNFDYGSLSDAYIISQIKAPLAKRAPYKSTLVGKGAIAYGLEVGYDLFRPFPKVAENGGELYAFVRGEYYNSYIPDEGQPDYDYTRRTRIAAGINWVPIPQIAVKAEYSYRMLPAGYNPEPSVSLGVVYMGFFKH